MKQLSDGTMVEPDAYYFLLDWNDNDQKKYINKHFNKQSLHSLSKFEFNQLLTHAIGDKAKTNEHTKANHKRM